MLVSCPPCDGTGRTIPAPEPPSEPTCRLCLGVGWVAANHPGLGDPITVAVSRLLVGVGR